MSGLVERIAAAWASVPKPIAEWCLSVVVGLALFGLWFLFEVYL
jgi:hypothetical protein